MIREITLMAAAALLGACMTQENDENSLNAWIGRPSSELTASWGQPTSTEKLPNGDVALRYDKQRAKVMPTGQFLPQTTSYIEGPLRNRGPGTSYGRSTGYVIDASPTRVVQKCITTFRTDGAGKIQ